MKVLIDKNDKGCCDKSCDFKNEKYCKLFGENLHGSTDNPTRCGECMQMTPNLDCLNNCVSIDICPICEKPIEECDRN